MTIRLAGAAAVSVLLCACGGGTESAPAEPAAPATQASASLPFTVTEIAKFNEPWAMTFLPDGRLLVTPGCYIFDTDPIGGGAAGAMLRSGPAER